MAKLTSDFFVLHLGTDERGVASLMIAGLAISLAILAGLTKSGTA